MGGWGGKGGKGGKGGGCVERQGERGREKERRVWILHAHTLQTTHEPNRRTCWMVSCRVVPKRAVQAAGICVVCNLHGCKRSRCSMPVAVRGQVGRRTAAYRYTKKTTTTKERKVGRRFWDEKEKKSKRSNEQHSASSCVGWLRWYDRTGCDRRMISPGCCHHGMPPLKQGCWCRLWQAQHLQQEERQCEPASWIKMKMGTKEPHAVVEAHGRKQETRRKLLFRTQQQPASVGIKMKMGTRRI